MKKFEIEGKIYYEMEESDFNKIKDDYTEFNKEVGIEEVFRNRKLTQEQLDKINQGEFDIEFEVDDIDIPCDDEDELDSIKFDENELDDGCDFVSPVLDPVSIDDFIFEFPTKDSEECRNLAETLASDLSILANRKIELVEKMGKEQNKFWHYRLAGSLFEKIRFYHANRNLLVIPNDWDFASRLSSLKLSQAVLRFKDIYNQQSEFLRIIPKPFDFFLEINFQDRVPNSGIIKKYYQTIENYVNQIDDETKKQDGATTIIKDKIESFKTQFIDFEANKLLGIYDEIAREIATSDLLQANGDLNKFLGTTNLHVYDAILTTWLDIKTSFESMEQELEQIESEILSTIDRVTNLPCKQEVQKVTDIEAGSGLDDYDWGIPDISTPTITDYSYWLRYCAMATIVNLIPIYYPIGILIANPSGLTKIPMPIIWIPIAVFTTPIGLFVILIGQCGTMPSPFIFHWNTSQTQGIIGANESKFIVSIRGQQDISTDTGNNIIMSTVPHVDENGGLTVASSNSTMQGILENINNGLTNLDPSQKPFPQGTLIPTQDDFPVWQRLSPNNILLLNYLRKWTSAGKKGGGFFEQ